MQLMKSFLFPQPASGRSLLQAGYYTFIAAVAGLHLLFPEFVQDYDPAVMWDSLEYKNQIQSLPEVLSEKRLDTYRVQRLLPQAVVYGLLRVLHLDLSDWHITWAFAFTNALLLLLAVRYWVLMARRLDLGPKGSLLGFTGIFFNFATLKMAFYYPVLTDTWAFVIGIAMLYYYLKGSDAGVLITAFAGNFTFPTLGVTGLLLYALPARTRRLAPGDAPAAAADRLLPALVPAGYLVLILALRSLGYTYRIHPVAPHTYWISVACTMIYLYLATDGWFRTKPFLEYLAGREGGRRVVLAGLALLLLALLVRALAGDHPMKVNYRGFLAHTALHAATNPLVFVVSHAVYYGPVFLLVILFWGDIRRAAGELGLGVYALLLLYACLGINSESRQMINVWPVFATVLCVALRNYSFPKRNYWLLFGLALAASRVWYRMNAEPFFGSILEFPYQRYFMTQGPWISDATYYAQGAVAAAGLAVCYGLFRR